jgi:hypothetical protein
LEKTGILEVPDVGFKLSKPAGTAPCKFQENVAPGVVLLRFTKAVF